MITGSHKCSTTLSYFRVKEQSLGTGGWHCTRGGRGALSKAKWGRRERGTAWVLRLLPRLQDSPSLKDGVFTASGTLLILSSYGRRRELWEIAFWWFMLDACTFQAEKHRWSGGALFNFIAVTCHSKAASAFQKHTAVSQALQHI